MKSRGVCDIQGGYIAVQMDPDRLEKQANRNLMKFNIGKSYIWEGIHQASVHGIQKIKPDCSSVVPADRTRGNGRKLKHMKFHLTTRKYVFNVKVIKHWNMLSRVAVESPSLGDIENLTGQDTGQPALGLPV